MFRPIFGPETRAAVFTHPEPAEQARDAALLYHATTLAIESAFRFGRDLPVGAVAAAGNLIVGSYFASDKRHGYVQMHAEYMAVMDSQVNGQLKPDTIAVTMEPCDNCQDFLATQSTIKRVVFGLSRNEAAAKGLVKPHDETIFSRALRKGLPYQVLQVNDEQLHAVGAVILDNTQRDTNTGAVEINQAGLREALSRLNG